jgi:hypothetical protein
MVQEKHENTWKIALLKSFGTKAVKRKDFYSASAFYTKVWYILCSSFHASNYLEIKNAYEQIFEQASIYDWVTKWQGLGIEKETWPVAMSRHNYLEKYG